MFAQKSTSVVPTHKTLRVLRKLALAGSTVSGVCTFAVLYDVNRRITLAEQIVENKRTLQTSAPNYDATSSAKRLKIMMEAAEAGEFFGLDSLKPQRRRKAANPRTANTPQESDIRKEKNVAKYSLRTQPAELSVKYSKYWGISEEALERENQERQLALGASKTPVDVRIRTYLEREKEVDAAKFAMRYMNTKHMVSLVRRQLLCDVFTANCLKGNIFIARSLFEFMQKVTVVDSEIWAVMIHLLAKEGHIESAADIFERYHLTLALPLHLLEIVLRCCLESRRLTLAAWLLFARIKDDRDCGLCGAYLDGLWRKTHDIKILNSEFQNLLSSLSRLEIKPTEKIFNPMVKCYIESGANADAEQLVKDMSEKFGVQPGCRSMGLILYGRAVLSDWDGVFDGLHEMHKLGLTREKQDFVHSFDRIFLEYYSNHSGPEIFEFIVKSINTYELVPDKVLYRHFLEALIERGDSEMVNTIMTMAQENKWNYGVNETSILDILSARKISMQKAPVGSWRMLQATKQQYGSAASSRQILGSSANSLKLTYRSVLEPIHRNADETYRESLENLATRKSIDYYVPLEHRMAGYIHAGKYTEALDIYERGNKQGYAIRPIHLKLATIAAIFADERSLELKGLKYARQIIRQDWPYWCKLPTVRFSPKYPNVLPIFFQTLDQINGKAAGATTLLKLALMEFNNICFEEPHLTVKPHASTSLARFLIKTNRERAAINVLTTVYLSKWRKMYGFDQIQLKMLLRAFTLTQNRRGIWWCMMSVLSRKGTPNKDFVVELQRLMPRIRINVSRLGFDDDVEVLQDIFVAILEKQKGLGDWSQISVDQALKDISRTQTHISPDETTNLPTLPLRDTIMSFDEEREFDFVREVQPSEASEWKEIKLVTQSKIPPEHTSYPAYYADHHPAPLHQYQMLGYKPRRRGSRYHHEIHHEGRSFE
ncbi:hypothetical protein N7495_000953 [Penicillium taxi]|uniref:uncharacterized protein n=1 Tax=Penicillium taxi TaxID=168475 RepID=UPI0025454C4A|nr:uncharacterized protein N7495_000953 [Penicillium taxi]KAJ5908271.1 hypothetical protein N7495_000953 [Penicillium taxi]